MDKVGFFGGSFDPIHLGHIHLAVELLEKKNLDKIVFCPVRCSPHKLQSPPVASLTQRIKMVEFAIASNPSFHLTTIEEKGEGPSYTFDGLNLFKENNPDYKEVNFSLILTQDSMSKFYLWKDVHSLCDLAPPLFGLRNLDIPNFSDYPDPLILPFFKKNIVNMPVLEISSTRIRSRLKNKLYCNHLLQADVLDFIEENKLYL